MLAVPKQPPQPDVAGVKQKRFKLDLLLRERPDLWPFIYERCKRDFVFWAEMFCYAWNEYAPGDAKIIALALYEFQRDMATHIIENVFRVLEDPNARWNAGADKARKMTATFTSLLICQWLAQFWGISTVITTKDKEEVDIQGNMNTPFERLRFQIERQPKQLLPITFNMGDKEMYKKRLINYGNGGQLSGVPPTGPALRQARALIWLADEFAFVPKDKEIWESSSGTIKIRLVFSTPNGSNCLFHYLIYPDDLEDPSEAVQFHVYPLDWFLHPDYTEGMRRLPDGTLTSSYMDALRASEKPSVIAKEYLRDHGDSAGGKVYFMFRKDASSDDELDPDRDTKTIYRSWDPGVTFAVAIGQRDHYKRLLCLKEFTLHREKVSKDTTVLRAIADQVVAWTDDMYAGWDIVDIGDPYGHQINGADQKKSDFDTLKDLYRIRVQSAFVRKIHTHERRTRGIGLISEMMVSDVELDDGTWTPQIVINNRRCPVTVKAFHDKYRYVMVDGQPTEEIQKNQPYNDIADCWRYMAIKLFDHNKGPEDEGIRIKRAEPTNWKKTEKRYYA